MPDKLHELQRLWLIEATRNNVFPMDDRLAERFNSDLAGRPVLARGTSQVLANGMGGLGENGIINVKNKSHSISAQVVAPEGKLAECVPASNIDPTQIYRQAYDTTIQLTIFAHLNRRPILTRLGRRRGRRVNGLEDQGLGSILDAE